MAGGRARQVQRDTVENGGRHVPWGLLAVAAAAALLAGALFANNHPGSEPPADPALAPFTPSASNPDPSKKIPGVVVREFPDVDHVASAQRVNYKENPPFGGSHDQYWAACDGVVYERAIRVENVVHSLEHGAVWIAYHPDQINGDARAALRSRVEGNDYMLMSPVPTLDHPISLQSWGHQLKLGDVRDKRIDQFIAALRINPFTHPEVGATCANLGPGQFDQDNPPPFEAGPPARQ